MPLPPRGSGTRGRGGSWIPARVRNLQLRPRPVFLATCGRDREVPAGEPAYLACPARANTKPAPGFGPSAPLVPVALPEPASGWWC